VNLTGDGINERVLVFTDEIGDLLSFWEPQDVFQRVRRRVVLVHCVRRRDEENGIVGRPGGGYRGLSECYAGRYGRRRLRVFDR